MITSPTFIECASTYLYSPVRQISTNPSKVNTRKVEAIVSSSAGRRFNSNASTKANFDQHIDICI